jgi:hypothetical protein
MTTATSLITCVALVTTLTVGYDEIVLEQITNENENNLVHQDKYIEDHRSLILHASRSLELLENMEPPRKAGFQPKTLAEEIAHWKAEGDVTIDAKDPKLQLKQHLTHQEKVFFYNKWGHVGEGQLAQASPHFCSTLAQCTQHGFLVECFPKACISTFHAMSIDYKGQRNAVNRVDTTSHNLHDYRRGQVDLPLCRFTLMYSGYIPESVCGQSLEASSPPSSSGKKAQATPRSTKKVDGVQYDKHGHAIISEPGS